MTNPKRKGILSGITRPSKPLTGGATRSALAAALTKIRPGDRVAFKGNSGTVQGVNERMIAVGSDFGYRFTILAQELLMKPIEINGQRLQLTAIERKEEEPVELLTEYEIVDRQVDEGVKPILPEPEAAVETEVQTEPESPAAPTLCIPEGATWRDLLTRDEYLELKLAGKTDGWVMEVYGAKGPEFAKWKNEQGLKGVKLNTNGTLHFPDELQAEPIAVPSFPDHDCNCGGTCGIDCKCYPSGNKANDTSPVPGKLTETDGEPGLAIQEPVPVEVDGEKVMLPPVADPDAAHDYQQDPPLTFAKASMLAAELEADIECCGQLIHTAALTEHVFLALEKIQNDSQAMLTQIENARVVF